MQNPNLVLVIAAISAITGLVVGSAFGGMRVLEEIRKEAVKAGVARYVADADGSSKFEWIVPTKEKP